MQDYRAQLGRDRLPRFQQSRRSEEAANRIIDAPNPEEAVRPPPREVDGLRPVSEIPVAFRSVFSEFTHFNKVCFRGDDKIGEKISWWYLLNLREGEEELGKEKKV